MLLFYSLFVYPSAITGDVTAGHVLVVEETVVEGQIDATRLDELLDPSVRVDHRDVRVHEQDQPDARLVSGHPARQHTVPSEHKLKMSGEGMAFSVGCFIPHQQAPPPIYSLSQKINAFRHSACRRAHDR